MYVETMTTEEKIKEFKRALDKVNEVSDRIMKRYVDKSRNLKNLKIDERFDFGIHKLNINNTIYYYHLSATRVSSLYQSKKIVNLSYMISLYTIQTHKNSPNKYIIVFKPTKENNTSDVITEIETHLISRYKERFLNDQTLFFEDTVQIYIKNNYTGVVCDLINGEVVKLTSDGVNLGIRVDKDTIKLKTFITEEQLREDQMLWSKYGELWSAHIDSLKYMIEHPYKYNELIC